MSVIALELTFWLSKQRVLAGIYNLGYGLGTTVNEIFDTLKDVTGYTLQPIHGPAKLGETSRIFLDASRAAKELNWKPTIPLHEGLKNTVEYFRSVEMAA